MDDPLIAARELVAGDMVRFQELLEEALEPQQEYLTATERQLYGLGKRLRPVMLLLSARLAGGLDGGPPLGDKVIKASVSLEMLHVATLIHDDVVDRATVRRGLPSVNASRGTQVAVLVGDLQFIQAVRCFAHAVETERDMHLVRLILDAGFKICCGELDEIRTDPDWRPDLLRARYLRTVDRKTGVLFGLACESGGYLMAAGSRATYVLGRFGRCFGRAFQIMDDLLDFVRAEEDSGKPQAIDLVQGCLSLPILYALDELPPEHPLHRIVRGQPHTADELKATVADVVLSTGFLRAYSDARESVLQGLSYLGHFPASPYRDALSRLAWYVVDREIAPPAQHPTGG